MANESKALSRNHAMTMILAILADGTRHGYEIAKEMERRSESLFSCSDGILYPVLHALEKEGMISSQWIGERGARRKRVYTLNEKGRLELESQKQAWEQYARALDKVLSPIQFLAPIIHR